MRLNNISDNAGATKARKRVGRGIGSGTGKTAGRGHKGQKSRSGVAIKGFEGGQMPIHMRLPKRGFNNIFKKQFSVINLGRLQAAIDAKKLDAKKAITADALIAAGVASKAPDGIRLLAKGALSTKIDIEVAGASASAIKAVEAAGGSVKLTATKAKTEEPQKAEPKKAAPKKAKSETTGKDEG